MKICKTDNCGEKHYAKGYCIKHYRYHKFTTGEIKGNVCQFDGCKNNSYSRGRCSKHYSKARQHNRVDIRHYGGTCKSSICDKGTYIDRDYCGTCQNKINRGLNPHIKNKSGIVSRGLSKYKNHYTMKKARLKKLKEVGCKCEHCGIEKKSSLLQMHHIDGSKDNHSYDNFLLLCQRCHMKEHGGSFKQKAKAVGLVY